MGTCTNQATKKDACPCTYACNKRGNCCACVAYHRNQGQVPGCFFSKKGEATWDRSIRNLCKDQGLI